MKKADLSPWQTLAADTVFEAQPYMRVIKEKIALPDGTEIDDFYQVEARPFALIVPVLEDGTILLLRQYKHGPRRSSLTFPAGYVENGEDPRLAAERELLEETGCDAASWLHLGSFASDGNQGHSTGHFFLARGCRQVQDAASGDLEEMQAERWQVHDLDDALREGEFAIMHHVAAWGLARMVL